MSSPEFPLPIDRAGFVPRAHHRSRRMLGALIATALAAAAFLVQAPLAGAALPVSNLTPQIGLIPFPIDVYVLNYQGALVAVEPVSTSASAQLFNLAGNPLNLTWGQFSSATAKSAAWNVTYKGTTYTQFLISLSSLVPKGVYSLFYRTFGPDSNNPLCPNVEPQLALTAAFPQLQKPDPDSFIASSSGKGLFFASVPQDLLAAEQLQVDVIYHFDGKTYGPLANAAEAYSVSNGISPCRSSYGVDAMRQLLIIYK